MKVKLISDNGKEFEMVLTEEQAELLKKETKRPQEGDKYWYVGTYGPTTITEHNDHPVDYGRINLGNAFHTEQEAENTVRALKLIEAVRQDRLKMNDGWKPKREDSLSYIVHGMYSGLYTEEVRNVMYANVFGFYQNVDDARQIINKYRFGLAWYFTKFLPERG